MNFRILIIMVLAGFTFNNVNAQEQKAPSLVLDGIYEKDVTEEKGIIPYDHIREADVFWSKRIWRVIDVREKMNLRFKYPRQTLISIIHESSMNGELTVYRNVPGEGDRFVEELPLDEVLNLGKSVDTSIQIDPITLEEVVVIAENELEYDKVVKYRVKEDWFFDEETSTFQVRIIGLAPVRMDFDRMGNYRGDEVMYWVYYPDLRPILTKFEAYNAGNDAIQLSWEDIFEARLFTSYIFKESNVHDRTISEYTTGVEALLESERIKNELFELEHDLWSY
ncbi:MAG: gliding motility protein GldN [Chitinophagales bacterium]|nr:gliding motility protein GldN [Chitinophagales bacterium]